MSDKRVIPIHILMLDEISRGLGIKEFVEKHGISLSTLYTNLYKLMSEGMIEKRNGRYVVTEKGLEFLRWVKSVYRKFAEDG